LARCAHTHLLRLTFIFENVYTRHNQVHGHAVDVRQRFKLCGHVDDVTSRANVRYNKQIHKQTNTHSLVLVSLLNRSGVSELAVLLKSAIIVRSFSTPPPPPTHTRTLVPAFTARAQHTRTLHIATSCGAAFWTDGVSLDHWHISTCQTQSHHTKTITCRYRYYPTDGRFSPALFPFGWGLTYSNFSVSLESGSSAVGDNPTPRAVFKMGKRTTTTTYVRNSSTVCIL
jgi:hypothetical protein